MNVALKSLLPASALDADKLALLERLTHDLQPAELYWIAAYSAALAVRSPLHGLSLVGDPQAARVDQPGSRLTVVYGSQTGNSRRVAEQLVARAESNGLSVRLLRAGAYALRELAQERYLVVVISSQGDGDPPDDAIGFVEFIAGKRAPKLAQLKFAVLGLGDSSYPKYCAVSRNLDARFVELGAQRFAELGEADVDFESVVAAWSDKALDGAKQALGTSAGPVRVNIPLHAVSSAPVHSRDNPFPATVLENQRIVSRDCDRVVRHIELSLEGSGLRYEAGDALGVWPQNPPVLVDQLLSALKLDGATPVALDGKTLPLARWLGHQREITRLTRPFVLAHAELSRESTLQRLLQPEQKEAFAALLESHQPIDLMREYPASWDASQLVTALRPLTPRLYSIASSPAAVGHDEIHVTVGIVEYSAHGSTHFGAASTFLAGIDDDARVPVFIEPNERFRLPADGSSNVIMIGPGTGIAPFRAFVQERQANGATGRNWLFFGNRHFRQDFLYQTEWLEALQSGALHRLDLAFSRDSAQKTYVQQRMLERGAELYAWLREGAYLYVCGDSSRMARDVNEALLQIIAQHGALSAEDAKAWLAQLLQQGRYARDVY